MITYYWVYVLDSTYGWRRR